MSDKCKVCQYSTKYVGKAPCEACGGLGEPAIKVLVCWSVEFGDGTPPPKLMWVPQTVYDNAMTNPDFEDDVSEWLTDQYDFLVRDWKLAIDNPVEYDCD